MGLKASGGPSGKGRKRGGLRSQAGVAQVRRRQSRVGGGKRSPTRSRRELRSRDKANRARLGAAEDRGGMNKPAKACGVDNGAGGTSEGCGVI